SNPPLVGALLGTILAAGVLPSESLLSKATYAGLNLLFGVLILIAAFFYLATQRAKVRNAWETRGRRDGGLSQSSFSLPLAAGMRRRGATRRPCRLQDGEDCDIHAAEIDRRGDRYLDNRVGQRDVDKPRLGRRACRPAHRQRN